MVLKVYFKRLVCSLISVLFKPLYCTLFFAFILLSIIYYLSTLFLNACSKECIFPKIHHKNLVHGSTSLVIWWLRLWASNAGVVGLIPCQGTMIQYDVCNMDKKKIHGKWVWKLLYNITFNPLTDSNYILAY